MPELPEVETVRRTLAPHLEGRTVTTVWRSNLALRREPPQPTTLRRALLNARVAPLARHGKYLLLTTQQGGVLCHLGMSGQLTLEDVGAPLKKHTHVRLGLGRGQELRYVDPRRFGLWRAFLGSTPPQDWTTLGPDPLTPQFTPPVLGAALARTTRAVKLALLDQALVAGLGNIYVAEALFLAGVHPGRPAHKLTPEEHRALHAAVVSVLTQGLQHGGTTLNDYVDGLGGRGSNQEHLAVYGRAGEVCVRCGGVVRGVVMGARSTFFCPVCQPRGGPVRRVRR
jgi:formamidopyrimidine-DNA glycosylase